MEKDRVIIVTPGGSFFRDPHVRAFEKHGYECSTFDSRHGFIYTTFFRGAARRIPILNYFKRMKLDALNRDLVEMVKKEKPKYLFAQKAETIYPSTVDAIKALGTVTINFYNDLMGDWPVIHKIAPHYDFFFSQDHVVLKKLWHEMNLKNCFYMTHAAEPLPDPFTDRHNEYPVSFIGTYNPAIYPNREKYLMAIKDLGLHIWGNDEWKNTALRECFHGRAHGDERFDIYRKSKIVIDINWDFLLAEGLSNRPFEVTGCGAMFITDEVRADIRRAYKEGEEVVLFKNEDELKEKVKYYLEHDQERERIALAGYQRTVADHTYDKKIEQIVDTIKNPEKYLHR